MSTKPARKGKPHIGSDFDDFLIEEGIYNETAAIAVKRVLAFELEVGMQKAQSQRLPRPSAWAPRVRSLIGC